MPTTQHPIQPLPSPCADDLVAFARGVWTDDQTLTSMPGWRILNYQDRCIHLSPSGRIMVHDAGRPMFVVDFPRNDDDS